MPTVSTPCTTPGCPHMKPCPDHDTSSTWTKKATRRSGRSLQRRNRGILSRDGYLCHICREPGADQVDHVIALSEGGSDTPGNLAAIHAYPCHALKSEQERQRGLGRSASRSENRGVDPIVNAILDRHAPSTRGTSADGTAGNPRWAVPASGDDSGSTPFPGRKWRSGSIEADS